MRLTLSCGLRPASAAATPTLVSGGSIGGGAKGAIDPLDAVHRLLDGVHLPYTRLHRTQNIHQI